MSYPAIREQVRTILSGVSGTGIIHDYNRWAVDWGKFINFFKVEATGIINGAMITRKTRKTFELALDNVTIRLHEIVIRQVMGLKDDVASEITFQQLVDDICDGLEAHDTLNGTCLTISDIGEGQSLSGCSGPQAEVIENRVFGNVLCHYAEIHIYAQEQP
jgi:hypothetical protein